MSMTAARHTCMPGLEDSGLRTALSLGLEEGILYFCTK